MCRTSLGMIYLMAPLPSFLFLSSFLSDFSLYFRIARLRLCPLARLPRRRRLPPLLQRLRPHLALQRQEQVDRRDQEAPPLRARHPLRLPGRPQGGPGHGLAPGQDRPRPRLRGAGKGRFVS